MGGYVAEFWGDMKVGGGRGVGVKILTYVLHHLIFYLVYKKIKTWVTYLAS